MSPLPKDLVDQVAQMDLHPRTIRNVRMQYRLAEHTLIPWLRGLGQLPTNAAVCEIGCAEGGVLAAFAQLGASYTLGTDIQGALLTQISDPLWRGLGLNMEFTQHDVIYEEIPPEWRARFDIVLLRDVIEHLDDPAIALKNIARLLKPGGVVLVTFPPYTSAFGGFVKGGDPVNQEELERLHTIRCSARKVLSSAHAAGLRVRSERYFGLRPVFRWKYQRPIPSFEITALRSIPGVRALAMEAAFVFQLPA